MIGVRERMRRGIQRDGQEVAPDAVALYERVALAGTTGVLVLVELFDPHPAVDKSNKLAIATRILISLPRLSAPGALAARRERCTTKAYPTKVATAR
jgi:hypothetical protein